MPQRNHFDREVAARYDESTSAMFDPIVAEPWSTSSWNEAGAGGARCESGTVSLVDLVFNTIMNLTSQAQQVRCFRNAADHLEPGAMFVVEVGVPDLRGLPPATSHVVFRADETGWGVDEYDVVDQGLVSHHLERTEDGVREFSVPFRYVLPAELDLMAEMAGMGRVERGTPTGSGRRSRPKAASTSRFGSMIKSSRGGVTRWPGRP